MRSPLDWSLSYPGEALDFGSVPSGYVFREAPELGPPDVLTDDAQRPRDDGTAFGMDYFSGRTITFALDVVGEEPTEEATRRAVQRLARAWRADSIRQSPGAVATLVARYPGVERLTYGRPRRFSQGDFLTPGGVTDVVCDFATIDTTWYDVVEQTQPVALVPEPSGGLLAPLASPLATSRASNRSAVFSVGGDLPTWPVFEVDGPIANPVVEVLGVLRMEFRLSLAYDERLVVDTRPWRRTVLRNGASVAGAATRRSTRIARASIPPGTHEFVLRGSSATGTATARVRWRSAFSSL